MLTSFTSPLTCADCCRVFERIRAFYCGRGKHYGAFDAFSKKTERFENALVWTGFTEKVCLRGK